ncbi:MAG: hypothetical protein APR62_13380 [Smithella sp. SDB]|nr:MAG: hypothetical protein APR62_13380 [Smithella sp. SDB]
MGLAVKADMTLVTSPLKKNNQQKNSEYSCTYRFYYYIKATMLNVFSKIKNIIMIFMLLPSIVRCGGGMFYSAGKALRVFLREGWEGVKQRILFVDGFQNKLFIHNTKNDIGLTAFNNNSYREPVLLLPFDFPQQDTNQDKRIAVILHAFHINLVPEFCRYLKNICHQFDLFVSTDTESKADFLQKAFAGITSGILDVRVVQNRGRDIAPKLITFRDVYESHTMILHLHTKASFQNADLAGWLDFILKCLLGSPAIVKSVLETFDRVPQLGILAPRTFPIVRSYMNWGVNFECARAVAARMGIAITPDSPLDFPAGSMFWVRSAALKPLLDLGLTFDDFPEEIGQVDGTLAHAIERLYFYSCEKAGLRWIHAGDDTNIQSLEYLFVARDHTDLERCASDQMPALLMPGIYPRPTGVAQITRLNETALKQTFRDCCKKDMEAFFSGNGHINLPVSDNPKLSVIMVLFNQAELTFHCLQSLQSVLDVPAEVIIVDNASSDRTAELLARVNGARILKNSVNQHFLHGVNTGAEYARGKYLLLLNNDTRVKRGSISTASRRLDEKSDIGAVGGKIISLNGVLQEAGSIIWRDGSCIGYGRGCDPGKTEFQFCRDVDYCSGAFLMVKRNLFERLKRFDTSFAPAYYEETDLCMRIHEAGFRVVYDPEVEIMHFESGSSVEINTENTMIQRNRVIFTERHSHLLNVHHFSSETRHLEARMRRKNNGRVLVVDDRVPFSSLGSGYPRAANVLKALIKAGLFVTFYPLIFPYIRFTEAYTVFSREMEIIAGYGRMELVEFLRSRSGYYDAVIVSRPHNMEIYSEACRVVPEFPDQTTLIYDAEAIFAARELLHPEKSNDKMYRKSVQQKIEKEIALATRAEIIVTVNDREAEMFRAAGHKDVRVIGHSLDVIPTERSFALRRDFLFVGALDDNDSPNTDSLVWFVKEVMPLLDCLIGVDYVLNVVGRNQAPKVRELAGKRVRLLGRLEDIRELYDQSRVFIAPTRYAGGIPIKVYEAASMGLPVVATSLLGRQLSWADKMELLTADNPEDFAEACQCLYESPEQWTNIRKAALVRVAQDCRQESFEEKIRNLMHDKIGNFPKVKNRFEESRYLKANANIAAAV